MEYLSNKDVILSQALLHRSAEMAKPSKQFSELSLRTWTIVVVLSRRV